jgi:ribosomal protein S18 acetylase RimI-like enzyme
VDAIRALLNQDPVWSAYALADMQPAYAPYCRWQLAENGDGPGKESGVVLLYAGLTPEVLFSSGAARGVQAGLAQAELPEEVYITIPDAHLPVVERFYDFGASLSAMRRMVYMGGMPVQMDARPVVRLGAGDANRIRALYAHGGPFTPDAFDPYQLPDGVFYAVEDCAGALLAVGGTHIVDWRTGIAAIGNMYTRPDARGRGLASTVLHAIVDELTGRGVATIVLNVAQTNTDAQRLYARHGFAVHCAYWEGVGRRKHG